MEVHGGRVWLCRIVTIPFEQALAYCGTVVARVGYSSRTLTYMVVRSAQPIAYDDAAEARHVALRHEFLLDPDVVFLNHGSFGACPRPVFERYQAWQVELERQPVEFLGRRQWRVLAEARA